MIVFVSTFFLRGVSLCRRGWQEYLAALERTREKASKKQVKAAVRDKRRADREVDRVKTEGVAAEAAAAAAKWASDNDPVKLKAAVSCPFVFCNITCCGASNWYHRNTPVISRRPETRVRSRMQHFFSESRRFQVLGRTTGWLASLCPSIIARHTLSNPFHVNLSV
jgi:hypothetical protein